MADTLARPQSPTQTCKKCTQVIVEGHAYELGEDRWHIHCFKCFKCDKSLGCNSNFLVLGNGSLVCSSCSYSCKQCGKKIDDLAILTGDQAYCSSCFKCRACKLKIEDLRYARTSKGLFCMACHEDLLAKKNKHEMKRKQLASLSLLLRPSPDDHASAGDLYLQRNASLSSLLHKLLPPHPQKPTLVPLPAGSVFSGLPAGPLDSTSYILTPGQDLSAVPSHGSQTEGLATSGDRLLNSALPATPLDSQTSLSHDIEEVNDSDDELNLRRVREKLERRFQKLSESDGAILDLIDSFSAPNTPSTIYNDPEYAAASGEQSRNDLTSMSSRDTPVLKPDSMRRGEPRGLEHTSPHRNILILSPNQFHDNEFHMAKPMPTDASGKSLSAEDIYRPRSAASSPMAKVNRHARVVETNDEISTNEISAEMNNKPLEAQVLSTPKKSPSSNQNSVTSPPPRLALPELPSTPSIDISSKSEKTAITYDPGYERYDEEPKGLGLEGVELQKTPRSLKPVKPVTPAVTNLEKTFELEDADYLKTPPSRKLSVRSKMLLKHKRSTSNGSNSLGGKLGFFKNRDENGKGHTRHVLEGSAQVPTFPTPPLPFTSPIGTGNFRDNHTRSSSDTNFTMVTEDSAKKDNELRAIRFEIYKLDGRRQTLLAENMKLISEKGRLQEAIKSLLQTLITGQNTQERLSQEVSNLAAEKAALIQDNERLKSENESLRSSVTKHSERSKLDSNSNRISQFYDAYGGDPYDHSLISDSTIDENTEAQKATRLKFWRRPKVTIAPASQPSSTQHGANGQSNGGIPHSRSTHKLGYSGPIQNPQHAGEDASGPRKALNTFMSKSRSTTLLDSIVNGQSSNSECPLFTSTLQRRAIYENQKVPLIITMCLQEVERRGFDIEGIYRLSGGNSAIVAIENAFASASGTLDLSKINDVLSGDINAVTSALKRYLRKLPDPLVPFGLYENFIRIGQNKLDPDACLELANRVVNKLPPANKHAMYMIGKHLDQVNAHSNLNRMNFKNLSVVFAPTIARDSTGEREMIDMGPRNDATELLFTNFARVFAGYTDSA